MAFPCGGTVSSGGTVVLQVAIENTLLASAAVGFGQQNKDPVSSVVKEILLHQEKNLVAAVEEMPADKFGYKPTPQQMSFAGLVLHITESNSYFCAKAADVPEPNKGSRTKRNRRQRQTCGGAQGFIRFLQCCDAKSNGRHAGRYDTKYLAARGARRCRDSLVQNGATLRQPETMCFQPVLIRVSVSLISSNLGGLLRPTFRHSPSPSSEPGSKDFHKVFCGLSL
jgi:hypothetical protein